MLKTKSIIPSWIVHISFNIIGFISMLFLTGEDLERLDSKYTTLRMFGIITTMMIIIMIMIIGLVLLIIEIIKHKDSLKLKNNFSELSERKKLAIYFSAPLTVLFVTIYASIIIYLAIPK